MEIIIIIGLILLNGIFSMSEMSLVSSRRFKLESEKERGSSNADTALKLAENPTKFLSTVQIGITLIGILLGVYSGEGLTQNLANYLADIETIVPYANSLATVIIVVVVTYVSIVVGELLPKRIGMTFPEPIAMLLAKPMRILASLTSPFVWLLTASNNLLLKILGIKNSVTSKVSEEEIKSLVKESALGGEIKDIEQDIVERVFELGDRKIKSLHTHKRDLVFFSSTDSWDEVTAKIKEEKHSAYPVVKDNNLDSILGIVLLKDLFFANREHFDIHNYIKKPLFFNENTFAYNVLESFKKHMTHYAIIVDEYGATEGMVTMSDVLEALVGDITEGNDDEYKIVKRDVNSWFVDGQYDFLDFKKYFKLELDDKLNDQFTTVAGFIIYLHDELPELGDKIHLANYEFEIIDKDGHRIDKILVTRVNKNLII